MPAIFLTRQVGADELSDDDQDQLIEEIQDALDTNDAVLVLPTGWGVTISDSGLDPDYTEEEDDYYEEAVDNRSED